jgi:transposase
MARRGGAVHVVTTRREYKGKTYTSHLLRRSYREGDKVKNETVGNLSHLPEHVVELIRQSLKGHTFSPAAEAFEIVASAPHGHIQAVRAAMRHLGFDELIASRACPERALVVAMVTARIVEPQTKLSTTRWWHTTTLAEDLGVETSSEDDLYAAMDWLLARQEDIEKKLVARHLHEGSLVLYDLSSSYFEGEKCPLAKLGHNRDGKKGKLQVNYGLVTDSRGCPAAISVFEGNTSDSVTLLPEIRKLRERYGLKQIAAVGDRGMISAKAIGELKTEGLDWITALKSAQIRELVEGGQLQLGLFDERSLFEIAHPDYPGERLVACRNPELAKRRGRKRQSLVEATAKELEIVKGMVERGTLRAQAEIGVRTGRVVDKYKVAKHFELDIGEGHFSYRVLQDRVAAEAKLDGIYVIRTCIPQTRMTAEDAVRNYKLLSNVERAFRSMKTIDLKVRPIHHRLEDRVRSHIFLCMLAYYVEWHMREAWRPLLFADEDQAAKKTRDPVAPAKRSNEATLKARSHTLPDGTPVHSFQSLMEVLATVVRNTCRTQGRDDDSPTFALVTTPTPTQQRALALLETIAP